MNAFFLYKKKKAELPKDMCAKLVTSHSTVFEKLLRQQNIEQRL